MRPIWIIAAALLLSAPQDGRGVAHAANASDKKAVPGKKEVRSPPPPMVFFVAKGAPDSCGSGCGEWIAADGTIDRATPGRLRALLGRLGKRKLPIYFHSPGGSVDAALELGRMMRARDMQAGVARTIPQGCDPAQIREAACDTLKRSGRELGAALREMNASCNSACVYAFLGAKVRTVPPGAGLGVHSISILRTMIRRNHEGRVLAISSTRITGNGPDIRSAHGGVARYAAEMGIGRALIDAAAAVPHETIRYLTRGEIARFGIDPREVVESQNRGAGKADATAAVRRDAVSAGLRPQRFHQCRVGP